MNQKGFTLIELLVVVAIIGILAAVGVVAYSGYTEGAKKAVAKSNFKNAVKYFIAEGTKCSIDSSQKIFGGLNCPLIAHTNYQTCAAIYLSWEYGFRNPNLTKEAAGWTAGSSLPCAKLVTGDIRGGIRSGDGQVDVTDLLVIISVWGACP